ncbi:hypothetical protein ABEO75_30755 [Paenibacillus macerans]|uniref:hypothetical protein n=1 Tax=Paenibacillus macerans TaxID=44252 RepID=UPI002E1FE45D|nr:hypothetical protein [Paenibacillus macerans]
MDQAEGFYAKWIKPKEFCANGSSLKNFVEMDQAKGVLCKWIKQFCANGSS